MSASWLDRQLRRAPRIRNRFLREISWVSRRSIGVILERGLSPPPLVQLRPAGVLQRLFVRLSSSSLAFTLLARHSGSPSVFESINVLLCRQRATAAADNSWQQGFTTIGVPSSWNLPGSKSKGQSKNHHEL